MTDTIFPTSLPVVLAAVRTLLNEETPNFWTDAEITTWIQEGSTKVSSAVLCVEDVQDITLIAATLEYASLDGAGDDVDKILSTFAVLYEDGSTPKEYTALTKIHPRMIGAVAHGDDGPVRHYWHFNDNIGVWPMITSTESGEGATLRVFFSKVTDDVTALPDVMQSIVINYAAYKALLKDRKYNSAGVFYSQYAAELNFQRQDWREAEKMSPDSKDMRAMPDRSVTV